MLPSLTIVMQSDLLTNALSGIVGKFASAVPRVLGAIFVFLICWILASMVYKVLLKALQRLKVDALGEKLQNIDIVQKSNLNLKLSVLISKLIYYTFLLFGALAATSALGMPEVSELMSRIIEFIPNLFVGLIVLILGTLFADAIRSLMLTTLKSLGVGAAGIISSGVFYFLFINIVISALSQAKLDTEFLSQNISIVIGGIVFAFAIGYGLASKDTMANFISSFYSSNTFSIGDIVTIDGVHGQISEITKTSISIKTENSTVLIPLNKALSQKIEFHK